MKTWVLILAGVLLLFAASQISIPIQPIPITMQTVAVMLIGLVCRRAMACYIVIAYLTLGALGAPVFANFNSGFQKLIGASGGYLWGFLAAVILMTTLRSYLNNGRFSHIVANCFAGTLLILIIGVAWLAKHVGFAQALQSGFYPFIIPGIIKIFIASIMFYFSYKLVPKRKK